MQWARGHGKKLRGSHYLSFPPGKKNRKYKNLKQIYWSQNKYDVLRTTNHID